MENCRVDSRDSSVYIMQYFVLYEGKIIVGQLYTQFSYLYRCTCQFTKIDSELIQDLFSGSLV